MARFARILDALSTRGHRPGSASQAPPAGPPATPPEPDPDRPPHLTPVLADLVPGPGRQRRLVELLPESMVLWRSAEVDSIDLERVDLAPLAAPYVTMLATAAGDTLTLGLTGEGGLAVLAVWEEGAVRIEVTDTEGNTRVLGSATLDGPLTGRRLAITVTENIPAVWESTAGRWSCLCVDEAGTGSAPDLRQLSVLEGLRFTHRGAATDLRAGYFGYLGLRDPHAVENALNGQALSIEGRALVTLTCAGPAGIRTAHWGLFSIKDDDPSDLRLETAIFTERDDRALGDHAGQIARGPGWRYELVVSGWGDFVDQAQLHRAQLTGLPSGPAVRVPVQPMPVPSEFSVWDPTITVVDNTWQIAFVECWELEPRVAFRPVLVRTQDLATPGTRVRSEDKHAQTEGMMFVRSEHGIFVLATDGDARDFPVYDLNLHRIGTWPMPYGDGIPHLAPIQFAGRRVWLTSTGDPYHGDLPWGSHGDLVVHPPATPPQPGRR